MTNSDVAVTGTATAVLAGGGTLRTAKVVLRSIEIGPWRLTGVDAMITRGGDCLLGMSVLTQFGRPIIDFAGQRLILEN